MRNDLVRVLMMLFSVLGAAQASAEVLTISVFEKGGGGPVPNATVVVLATEQYVTTDEEGNARFDDVSLPLELKVLAAGYETLEKWAVKDAKHQNIFIATLPYLAEGLEAVADRIPEKVSKFQLTASELANTPGSQGDPIVAVSSLPGMVTSFEGTGLVYMRGSDFRDNLTLVNRVPVGYLFHLTGSQSTINPEIITDLNIFLDFRWNTAIAWAG